MKYGSQVCECYGTKIYSYEFPLTKMFSGFISLCTIRCAWRYTRASPSCCMTLTASCSQKCSPCKMASNRSPPYSKIEIYSRLPQHMSGTNVQIWLHNDFWLHAVSYLNLLQDETEFITGLPVVHHLQDILMSQWLHDLQLSIDQVFSHKHLCFVDHLQHKASVTRLLLALLHNSIVTFSNQHSNCIFLFLLAVPSIARGLKLSVDVCLACWAILSLHASSFVSVVEIVRWV